MLPDIIRNDPKNIGWWDNIGGSGQANRHQQIFVLGVNNLGGCHGSTGPSSINPETGQPYGANFPVITVEDWVESQARLADRLGIRQLPRLSAGVWRMQAMQWSLIYPDRVRHVFAIAAAPNLTAQTSRSMMWRATRS